jgi:hypothetical protein
VDETIQSSGRSLSLTPIHPHAIHFGRHNNRMALQNGRFFSGFAIWLRGVCMQRVSASY